MVNIYPQVSSVVLSVKKKKKEQFGGGGGGDGEKLAFKNR